MGHYYDWDETVRKGLRGCTGLVEEEEEEEKEEEEEEVEVWQGQGTNEIGKRTRRKSGGRRTEGEEQFYG